MFVVRQTSRFISTEEAYKAGLVDAVVFPENLLPEARRWALDIAEGRKPWNKSLTRTDHLGSDEDTFKVIKEARVKVQRMFPNVPHPTAMLDAVETGFLKNPHVGTEVVSLFQALK
jgi:enoyl-CoA hydratase/3-hydroxyacyl-CoA dehydrogenase